MKSKSTNDNKAIIRRYIGEIINTGNTEHISDFISSDYVEVFQNKTYPVRIDGAVKHTIGVRETYPDLHITIDKQIAEGEWVVTCYTMTGTHLGMWMGIKPTGKKIVCTGVNVDRLIDGKIVEHGGAANLFHSLLNIGAIKIIGNEDKK
jgi:predicted ester cyclase